MTQSQGIVVLGSTGSVGVSTLDVLSRHREGFHVVALTARANVDLLFRQCQQHRPSFAVVVEESAGLELQRRVAGSDLPTEVLIGAPELQQVTRLEGVVIVMAAIVGAAGLLPVLEAVRAGKRVLIANKEPLAMLGGVFVSEARRSGATLLPIDSEHNAVFQCLPADATQRTALAEDPSRYGVNKIILTGSGGPFRNFDPDQLHTVTPEQACAHPNWDMGRKISVDSATMMNKGLEIIEAGWLFNLDPDRIEVVIHPQSVIHSLVEYVDGSVLAQLGSPDMRIPIAHALAWPQRMESGATPLDLCQLGRLDFEPPQPDRFPCLQIAQQVARRGGTAPAVINAANEIAVAAFLNQDIEFTGIPRLITDTLDGVGVTDDCDLSSVLAADHEARRFSTEWVRRHGGSGSSVQTLVQTYL